jgi:hypothetical protein
MYTIWTSETKIITFKRNNQKQWLEHLERMPESEVLNLLYQYKPVCRRCQGYLTKLEGIILILVTRTDQELNLW